MEQVGAGVAAQRPGMTAVLDPPVVPLTIGVTGHRDLREDQLSLVRDQVRAFFRKIPLSRERLPLRIMSGLAEGADRLVARLALEEGHEVVAVLPFEQSIYEQDFQQEASLEEFRALLAHCEVVVLGDGDGEALDAERRDQAYGQQGIFISDHSQILLALWDGLDVPLVGGTSQVVNFHQFGSSLGLESVAAGRDPLAEDDSDLVYHIRVGRQGEGEASTIREISGVYLIADPQRRAVDELPTPHRLMLSRMATFNDDLRSLGSSLAPDAQRLSGWEDSLSHHTRLRRAASLFAACDSLAIRFQRRFLRVLQGTHVLAALMGLSFIAYADLEQEPMIIAFLLFFGIGAGLYRLAQFGEWHRRYLDYRALAEGLRVQFYWQLGGVSGRQRNDFAYDNFLQKQDVEIGWIRNVMSFAATPLEPTPPLESGVERVIESWIGDAQSGQLGYFRIKAEKGRRHSRVTASLVAASLWLGIVVGVVLALFSSALRELEQNVLVVLMGLLPLVAGVRAAYAHKVAEKELIKQYRYMASLFERARYRLGLTKSEQERLRILRALGEAALDEHAEWILMHRERPLEHGPL